MCWKLGGDGILSSSQPCAGSWEGMVYYQVASHVLEVGRGWYITK